jgi:GntR family transcriptional regulator, arabinose operon transcriptional repressor
VPVKFQLHGDGLAAHECPNASNLVECRLSGGLWRAGIQPDPSWILWGDPSDTGLIRKFIDRARPEGIMCATDYTAGLLMHSFSALHIDVPNDIRIVGIDDVKYASLLPVPLTTLRQPCNEIGAAAIHAMLERIARPDIFTRDILLDCKLVVRRSCGSPLNQASA